VTVSVQYLFHRLRAYIHSQGYLLNGHKQLDVQPYYGFFSTLTLFFSTLTLFFSTLTLFFSTLTLFFNHFGGQLTFVGGGIHALRKALGAFGYGQLWFCCRSHIKAFFY